MKAYLEKKYFPLHRPQDLVTNREQIIFPFNPKARCQLLIEVHPSLISLSPLNHFSFTILVYG